MDEKTKEVIPVDPSESLPKEESPEEYLIKSKKLLEMDQPEAPTNNFLLFSPLLPVLAFTLISLTVIGYYVNQRQQQIAEIRSRAKDPIPATQTEIQGPGVLIIAAAIVLAVIIAFVRNHFRAQK